MIAKNIAPWINRDFAFEYFSWVDKDIKNNAIKEAKEKIITDKKYYLYWSDIDEEVLEMARKNAKLAWVDDVITFENKDVLSLEWEKVYWVLVSNPPYGLRLKSFDEVKIHRVLNSIFEKNDGLKWWIITAYSEFDNIIKQKNYKKRKLYNGNEKSYFYSRVGNR
jgi:putative N6-adenine-specific DNA methylase